MPDPELWRTRSHFPPMAVTVPGSTPAPLPIAVTVGVEVGTGDGWCVGHFEV
jgi:hypothetical protein